MKRRLRIAGWALGLSLAMAGIGAAVGASQGTPVEAAAEIEYHTFTIGWGGASGDAGTFENFDATEGTATVATGKTIGFTTAKNGSNNVPAYNANNSDLRLYYGKDGNANGCSVTFDLSNFEYSVTAVSLVSTLNPSVKYSIDGGAQTAVSPTGSTSPYTYSLSGLSVASSISFQNVNTSSTQLRIKTVTFTYAVPVETGIAESVEIEGSGTPYTGETFQLSATVHYQGTKADDNRVTWSKVSGDSTVDGSGLVTVMGMEPSEIRATAIDKGAGEAIISTTFLITPVANPITSISFDTSSAKKTYYAGQSFSIAGVTASATYTSTTVKAYALTAANFSGFDSTVPVASQIITVSAEENEHVFSTTYEIEIIERPALKFGTGLVDSLNTDAAQQVNDKYGKSWNVALTYADATKKYISYEAEFVHIGSGNNPVSSVSFSLDLGEVKTIKYLSIKYSAYKDDTGTIALSVGGVEKATGTVEAATIKTVSIPEPVRGQTINVSATSLAKINIYHIDYLAMTDAECVADFIDNYMHMDDYTENLGYCKDVNHHYYADAKAAFNALFPEQRALFASEDTYADARARLQNWAAANGDVFDVNNTLVKAYQGTFGGLTNNDPTAFAVAGLIGGMLLATGVGVLVIRRKKQK